MKKGLLMVIAMMLPWSALAMPSVPAAPSIGPVSNIPSRFLSSSETLTFEWGCPVSEVVKASTGKDALLQVGEECMAEARQAASQKPGVFEVIKVSVIVPDINVTKHEQGYMLQGTFFLETLVLKGME